MISLVIIPSKLPVLIKGTSTYQTASMRICHLLVTFYKCNDTFSLRGSFFKVLKLDFAVVHLATSRTSHTLSVALQRGAKYGVGSLF